ncbi:MAG: hypothetical protein F6K58_25085 [Symploca sp. SIO2E9]|nr:hypothetical protein [Symploca sp. SIO2E9]
MIVAQVLTLADPQDYYSDLTAHRCGGTFLEKLTSPAVIILRILKF